MMKSGSYPEDCFTGHDDVIRWKHFPRYQVVADSNSKYVLEIKDVPKFKDART